MLNNFFTDKKIFITGHTGFKGSWLSIFLHMLGAEVYGYSLAPPANPNLFELVSASKGIQSDINDIRNLDALKKAVKTFEPDILIHLAAQSLVKKSYANPVETYSTNIMGTVNLFEAVRDIGTVRAIVNVTSDKCYENKEWLKGYRESDPMGGYDPYSSSKGCSELITAAYAQSYFKSAEKAIASARTGNVIGGGDFAEDRLIPDMIRSFIKGEPVLVRNPKSIRPWQHVLDPLYGYLLLAKNLFEKCNQFEGGWNFGPADNDIAEVRTIVEQFIKLWKDNASWIKDETDHVHEAGLLKLDCSKANRLLGWKPVLNLETCLKWTVDWYKMFLGNPKKLRTLIENQIEEYKNLLQ